MRLMPQRKARAYARGMLMAMRRERAVIEAFLKETWGQ